MLRKEISDVVAQITCKLSWWTWHVSPGLSWRGALISLSVVLCENVNMVENDFLVIPFWRGYNEGTLLYTTLHRSVVLHEPRNL